MAFCGICGRHHSPNTPCAVANRPAGRNQNGLGGPRLARRVDWILAIIALVVMAYVIYTMVTQ